MLQVEMSASVRSKTGKGAMRRLRNEGLTPAVVYGAGAEAQPLQLESKPLLATLLRIVRRNAVITMKIDESGDKNVILKEVQTDPVTEDLIHADFCEIDLSKPYTYKVPLVFKGVAKGVDLGGELQKSADAVQVEGKPLDIPDEVSLDITNLNIGDKLTFADIALPENVTMISNADAVCVSVFK